MLKHARCFETGFPPPKTSALYLISYITKLRAADLALRVDQRNIIVSDLSGLRGFRGLGV